MSTWQRTPGTAILERVALLLLCAAYIQGSLTKLLDWPGTLAEMDHFGLRPSSIFAGAVITLELACSALVVSGIWRGFGALVLAAFTLGATLLALRFWELPADTRAGATNAFFEHLGLVGGFLLVALSDLRQPARVVT